MSATQRRDATLAELPPPVRTRVEQLEKLQEDVDGMVKEFEEKLAALREEYEKKKAPLFKQRCDVVKEGVPNFWLQALQNNMITSEEVQKDDVPVLAHLMDIKYSTKLNEGKKGFQLAFVFSPNEYFEDEILTKTYLMDPEDDDECLTKAIGTDIKWKPGKNVTVRTVQKKQKKKGKVRTVKVEEPTESFFQFFDPPEVPEEEDEMEEEEVDQLHESLESDYELGCVIKDKIIPRAVAWFTGMAIDPEDDYDDEDDDYDDEDEDDEDDDDDDDDDDDEEEDEEDEEDEDDAPPAKGKGKGGGRGKGGRGAGGGGGRGGGGRGGGEPQEGDPECKQQ